MTKKSAKVSPMSTLSDCRALALAVLLPAWLLLSAHAAEPGQADTEKPFVEIPDVAYLTLRIVRDPSVQRELKLRPAQVKQVGAAVTEVDHPLWLLRDVSPAQCRAKLDEHLAHLRRSLERGLSGEQLQRLDQIVLQGRGLQALLSSEMRQELKLNETQVARIRGLLETAGKDTTQHQAASRQVVEILSAEQAARVGELAGKPFDLSQVQFVGCQAPELRDVSQWINSDPLTLQAQRGKVVAVHFWAFGCINCVRNLPHYQGWLEKFGRDKLTIIGLHTPETEREKSLDNLRDAVRERRITYPVAFDAAAENWKAWSNHMWPSVYLIDKLGRVRYWWYGELNWQGATGEEFMRKKIEELIAEK